MAEFVKVATVPEIPKGTARVFQAGGTPVALYNLDGAIHATANACPHRGGPLGEGAVADGIITCPWHGFQFDVKSGRCLTNPGLSVPCLAVTIEGQDVLVKS